MTFKLGTTKWLSSQTFHNVSMECFPHHVTMAEVGTTNEGPTKRAQDISSLPWGRRGQEQQSIWEAKLCIAPSRARNLQGPGQEQRTVAAYQKEGGNLCTPDSRANRGNCSRSEFPAYGILSTYMGLEVSGIQEGGTMLSQEQGHSPTPALHCTDEG